jgi:transportin-1
VSEVLQSTFVLIGDIAIASFNILSPFLHDMVREMMQVLRNNQEYIMSASVYNNALWAIGEIVIRWKLEAQHYAVDLLNVILPLLTHLQAPPSIRENAVITLGRLGLACPESVAPFLRFFVRPWLDESLSVREGDEKDSAFRGLCAIIKLNPQGAQHVSFGFCMTSLCQHP